MHVPSEWAVDRSFHVARVSKRPLLPRSNMEMTSNRCHNIFCDGSCCCNGTNGLLNHFKLIYYSTVIAVANNDYPMDENCKAVFCHWIHNSSFRIIHRIDVRVWIGKNFFGNGVSLLREEKIVRWRNMRH